ncbi:MAG: TIR domain-containing protein [Dehalococcoidia bacterium]|jgi:hypothetical protein|nr:TIR domain-containing protein [Dehalococcoidia bacterium]
MAAKIPLLVQLEYFVGSPEAGDTAASLQAKFNDDPAVPGLRIPVYFTPDCGKLAPPEPLIATEAERVVVVLLADDYLAAHARTPNPGGMTWADYVVRLRELCDASSQYQFFPVQLSRGGWPIDTRLDDLSVLRAWAVDAGERSQVVARRLANLLIRQLRQSDSCQESPPVTIFLSHTKLDLEHEPYVVKSLVEHLTVDHPEKTWYDSGDISVGSPFKDAIERGVSDAALLAVQTDSYSSRSWCRREVLLAKRHQRPVVVVDAVQQREIRSFPYAGNTPVIRWNGRPQDVVDLLLLETLRHTYAQESLKKQSREGDDILPGSPELVTIVGRKSSSVLYPDPPLGSEELAVLKTGGIQVQTPLERHALENNLRDRSLVVALSVSEAEDLARYGLRKPHLDGILLELSRYLLLAGIRLAYGGHLQADGYTVRVADLLREPVVEQTRGEAPDGTALPAELITYIPWPTPPNVHDEARLGPLVEVRRCERPADLSEKLDASFVVQPLVEIPVDSPVRRFGWSRGLTLMRERQTKDVDARITVGGRLGPTGDGYKGRMPGVLEEAFLSIQAKRPVYLIGAYGGCTRLVIDALEGVARQELTWGYQSAVAYSAELRGIYKERGQVWVEYEEISTFLQSCGYPSLNNGLSIDENRELARTRSANRMVELLFLGLGRIFA